MRFLEFVGFYGSFDIVAGPETLAVPMALAGGRSTVTCPSLLRSGRFRPAWKMRTPATIGMHDVVVASLSLVLDDIGSSLLDMDAVAKKSVYLFWCMSSPSRNSANGIL